MKLYTQLPTLELLAGDTTPALTVEVATVSGTPPTGCDMYLVICPADTPTEPAATLRCDGSGNTYTVRIPSSVTAQLAGMYELHFALYCDDSVTYKKLHGILYVKPAATFAPAAQEVQHG